MKRDMQILKELIQEEALVAINGGQAVLKEEGYSVTLRAVPEDTVIIKTDRFPETKRFFRNNKSECKVADFVVITQTEKKGNRIIHIELKGGKGPSAKHVVSQLRGGACLLVYFRELGRRFWGQDYFLKQEHYEQRFVLIYHANIPKRATRIPPDKGAHDSPDKMLKLSAPNYLPVSRLFWSAVTAP